LVKQYRDLHAYQALCLQEGIRVPAGRECHVAPGKHVPLRFPMIMECHRAFTGMLPFVVAMEEGRYDLIIIIIIINA